jgi:hypothetical protein
VPPAVAACAISALLDLKDRLLVEAALAEVISLVAGHLDVLPVGADWLGPPPLQQLSHSRAPSQQRLAGGLRSQNIVVHWHASSAQSLLPSMQVATRVTVLRRLWPMIALLQSPTDRTTAFAASWRTALEMHLHASEAAAKGAFVWGLGLWFGQPPESLVSGVHVEFPLGVFPLGESSAKTK